MELLKKVRKMLNTKMSSLIMVGTMLFACSSVSIADAEKPCLKNGKWMTGDFHQHTTYTDGSNPLATVMNKNHEFGLDWWANSEHGGGFIRDGYGPILTDAFDTGEYARFWDEIPVTILGDVSMSGGHQKMWRWQSIRWLQSRLPPNQHLPLTRELIRSYPSSRMSWKWLPASWTTP